MKTVLSALTAFAVLAAWTVEAADAPKTYQFKNGRWFDGEKFVRRTAYSEWGRLRFSRPGEVDESVDLKGGYVVPPLCEAHNHNLGGNYRTREAIDRYLGAGIFYVKILSNLPFETGQERRLFNRPDSVDVAFANGGLTGPGGHPIKLRERLLGYGAYPDFTKETLVDHAYFVFESEQDVDRKFPVVLQFKPDFIKIFLLHSEEYQKRRDDPDFFGRKGLDPSLVPMLVERAHAHGLSVSAHVETGFDFHIAVAAGADEIAHLPGSGAPEKIEVEDAARAAQTGVVVATTASLAMKKEKTADLYAQIRDAQKHNIRLLKQAGATLAVGSDHFETDSRIEAEYLRSLGVFTDLELLHMWTRNCAQTTFPDRFIGELRENYEASFIVLNDNPLEDWSALEKIQYRFKDGEPLTLK